MVDGYISFLVRKKKKRQREEVFLKATESYETDFVTAWGWSYLHRVEDIL